MKENTGELSKRTSRAWWSAGGLLLLFVAFLFGQRFIQGTNPIEQAAPPDGQAAHVMKIYTSRNGMVRLDQAALRAAGAQISFAQSDQLHLYFQGKSYPFWLDGEGREAGLVFYGVQSENIYTLQAPFWLVEGDLPELEGSWSDSASLNPLVWEAPDGLSIPQGAYPEVEHLEENLLYSPQVEQGDHWLWSSLPAGKSQEFKLTLDHLAASDDAIATLRLAVWASTEAAVEPDHHLSVFVNEHMAADQTWDGKGRRQIDASFPASWLKEGDNSLRIDAPGDTAAAAEINYIDWLEITYPRLPVAKGEQLDFIASSSELSLQGFSDLPQVFDLTDPYAAQELDQATLSKSGQSYSLPIQPRHHYLAVSGQGWLTPERLEPVTLDPDLRDTNGADYLAIGPPVLLSALQPVLDWHRQQGLSVMAVPVGAIYDQFGYSLPDPHAIQAMIRFASEHWSSPPRYILLVGDATYDPRGYTAPAEANQLPTFLINTVFGGETASDVGFVQINDDPWPDLPIGRVPAQTPEQVRTWVDKTLHYEEASTQALQAPGITAVADGQDPVFDADAQAFLKLFPQDYPTQLYAPSAGVQGANSQIGEYFQNGDLLIAYFGHGSVNMWGKDRLFTTEDVKTLSSKARLPVVLNMTCLTGLYTHPKVESLAEALLWQPNGGAVAVLAPSSLTLPTDQSFLSNGLVNAMLADPRSTLGEIHLAARRGVPVELPNSRDVMETFMLFGDPALKLALPDTAAVR